MRTAISSLAVAGLLLALGSPVACATGFARTIGTPGKDAATSYSEDLFGAEGTLVSTADGGFAFAGQSCAEAYQCDAWIVRMDSDGQVLWQRTYGGFGTDAAYSLAALDDGGFIVSGQSDSFTSYPAAWVFRIDAGGALEFSKEFAKYYFQSAVSIVPTPDGGFAFSGLEGGRGTAWLAKLDPGGGLQWGRRYHRKDSSGYSVVVPSAQSMAATDDGGFVIAGDTRASLSLTGTPEDATVLRVDGAGNLIWDRRYGGSQRDAARKIVKTADGGFVFAGSTESFGAGQSDVWVVKLDPVGDIVWERAFGSPGEEYGDAVVGTADGGYLVAGSTDTLGGTSSRDFWVLKLGSAGNLEWQKAYGGPGFDEAFAVLQAADGDFVIAGRTDSFGAGGMDLWLLKVDAEGNLPLQPCAPVIETSGDAVQTLADQGTLGVLGEPSGATVVETTFEPQESMAVASDQFPRICSNQPPTADAGPDQTLVIGEVAQFDGSASSDPDGTVVDYRWDFGDGSRAMGVRVNHQYAAPGNFTVTLTVKDDLGASDEDSAQVTVLSVAGAIDLLADTVAGFDLQQGISNSLDSKLQNVEDALAAANAGQREDAANKLQAFIDETQAERGTQLTDAQADQLIALAMRILAAL